MTIRPPAECLITQTPPSMTPPSSPNHISMTLMMITIMMLFGDLNHEDGQESWNICEQIVKNTKRSLIDHSYDHPTPRRVFNYLNPPFHDTSLYIFQWSWWWSLSRCFWKFESLRWSRILTQDFGFNAICSSGIDSSSEKDDKYYDEDDDELTMVMMMTMTRNVSKLGSRLPREKGQDHTKRGVWSLIHLEMALVMMMMMMTMMI